MHTDRCEHTFIRTMLLTTWKIPHAILFRFITVGRWLCETETHTHSKREKKEEEAETIMKTSFASVVDGFYGDFNANILAEKKNFANLLYFIEKMICNQNWWTSFFEWFSWKCWVMCSLWKLSTGFFSEFFFPLNLLAQTLVINFSHYFGFECRKLKCLKFTKFTEKTTFFSILNCVNLEIHPLPKNLTCNVNRMANQREL